MKHYWRAVGIFIVISQGSTIVGTALGQLVVYLNGGVFDINMFWKMAIFVFIVSLAVLIIFSPFQIIYWANKRAKKRAKKHYKKLLKG